VRFVDLRDFSFADVTSIVPKTVELAGGAGRIAAPMTIERMPSVDLDLQSADWVSRSAKFKATIS